MLVLECGGVDVDGILVFVDNGRPEEYDDVDVTAVFLAFLLLKVFFLRLHDLEKICLVVMFFDQI